jgi:hypothetical protein
MVFRVITVLSVLGLAGLLSYRRFQKKLALGRLKGGQHPLAAYFGWISRSVAALLESRGRRGFYLANKRLAEIYPDRTVRWLATSLGASFVYLAASGLAFALFSARGMFGVLLLVHVVVGGVFAASLAAFVVIRAKENIPAPENIQFDRLSLKQFFLVFPRSLLRPAIFWVFVAAGLALAATALFSMLRFFSFDTQVALIVVHQYSALAAVLAAVAFFDSVVLRQE